jgi:hypothetical protein
MGLWPLSAGTRVTLRLAALALSPVLWFAILLLIREGRNVVLPLGAVIGAAVVRAQAGGGGRSIAVGRAVPALPGAAGILVSCHLRGMLALLDTWLGLAIAVIGIAWKLSAAGADPAAGRVLAMLTGIAISTQVQSGSGLRDTRYRLMPLAAWQSVLARDVAYLAVQLVLSAAFDPLAGLAFGMASLAAGRYPALYAHLRVERWRFASGRVLFGALQMIAGAMLSFAGLAGAAVAALLWAASVWWAGRVLARE